MLRLRLRLCHGTLYVYTLNILGFILQYIRLGFISVAVSTNNCSDSIFS